MPSVKKVEQKTVHLIEETEAIAALEILLSENELIDFRNSVLNFHFSHRTEILRKLFYKTYHHECGEILLEFIAWRTYIFPEARRYSVMEIYSKYTECISLIDKQPMKMLGHPNPYLLVSQKSGFETNFNPFSPTFNETIWLFKRFRYVVKPVYSDEEARLLILEDFDKERQKFERLREKFDDTAASETTYERLRIPENVRIEVWRRDGGKCARCGSREKLEYDHIVPVSKGGSNTARNVELLCEKHNRSKSNNIV